MGSLGAPSKARRKNFLDGLENRFCILYFVKLVPENYPWKITIENMWSIWLCYFINQVFGLFFLLPIFGSTKKIDVVFFNPKKKMTVWIKILDRLEFDFVFCIFKN